MLCGTTPPLPQVSRALWRIVIITYFYVDIISDNLYFQVLSLPVLPASPQTSQKLKGNESALPYIPDCWMHKKRMFHGTSLLGKNCNKSHQGLLPAALRHTSPHSGPADAFPASVRADGSPPRKAAASRRGRRSGWQARQGMPNAATRFAMSAL